MARNVVEMVVDHNNDHLGPNHMRPRLHGMSRTKHANGSHQSGTYTMILFLTSENYSAIESCDG